MKQISLIASLLIALASCNFNSNNANLAEEPKGKQFFKFDAIDYYFNNYDEEKLGELFDNESKSELDSIKKGIIIGEIPSGIDDLSFISYLTKTGYAKSTPVCAYSRRLTLLAGRQRARGGDGRRGRW